MGEEEQEAAGAGTWSCCACVISQRRQDLG